MDWIWSIFVNKPDTYDKFTASEGFVALESVVILFPFIERSAVGAVIWSRGVVNSTYNPFAYPKLIASVDNVPAAKFINFLEFMKTSPVFTKRTD